MIGWFGLWSLIFVFCFENTLSFGGSKGQSPKAKDQLWKYSSNPCRFPHTVDRENLRPISHICFVALSSFVHCLEGGPHRLLERFIDLLFRPEKGILILHPFVVA